MKEGRGVEREGQTEPASARPWAAAARTVAGDGGGHRWRPTAWVGRRRVEAPVPPGRVTRGGGAFLVNGITLECFKGNFQYLL